MKSSPPLTIDALRDLVAQDLVDTVIVAFVDLYGRMMGKRFDAEFFLESVADHGTHACDYLLTVDMEMEPVQGYASANWKRGYGDFHLLPDPGTLRVATWLPRTAVVLCDVYHAQPAAGSHQPELLDIAPRSILTQQLHRAQQLGLTAMGASELEYYIFRDSYRDVAAGMTPRPAGWYIEDYHLLQGTRVEDLNALARRHLKSAGIPTECSKGEWGLGQHELNLRYCHVLDMADRHILMKQCLKELAEQLGCSVTFMAKYDAQRAGSSSHIHLSLWRDGKNGMDGNQVFGNVHGSAVLGQVAAGWLRYLPEIMVFLAPTVNSYKRYQAGSWAPTRLAWSYDNRTAAVRVVGHGSSLRLECRVPGADCNPYLAFAGLLGAALTGIEQQLVPPPLFAGDVYTTLDIPTVPATLHQATQLFEQSSFARETFGSTVVDHYAHFFRTEQNLYDRAVTDWERQRYFERI